jgi:uncharacterized protein
MIKIIDTHTHFYTCERTDEDRQYLKGIGLVLPGDEGEIEGLKKFMKEDGIAISVNAPSALNEKQALEVNRRMINYNENESEIICLGTMHPDMCDPLAEAQFLALKGIKGIKLHPQVQNFYPEDERMKKIYKACEDEGLYILMHAGAGADPEFDYDLIKPTPDRIGRVIDTYPSLKFVAAHLGGLNMWEEAGKHIIGKKVYLDTAYCGMMDDKMMKTIIKIHGSKRILFGSDFPWQRQADMRRKLDNLLNEEDKENIYHKNAEELLEL